jgi:hypothetical protein
MASETQMHFLREVLNGESSSASEDRPAERLEPLRAAVPLASTATL